MASDHSRTLGNFRAPGRWVIIPLTLALLSLVGSNTRAHAQGAPGYYWNYSVKFVCGFHPEGAPVKPGNYLTDVDIHNYNYTGIPVWKKLVITVGQNGAGVTFMRREPQQAAPTPFTRIELGPDGGTMDDCVAITSMAGFPQGTPMIGYLVVISSLDLDIDAVYTAEVPGTATTTPTGISEDVVRVLGKRVYVPTALP